MHRRTTPSSLPWFFLFAVVSIGVALAILIHRFWLHAFEGLDHDGLRWSLWSLIALVGALIGGLIAFILGFQLLHSSRMARWEASIEGWIERWREALDGRGALPRPLPRPAIEAWIRLVEGAEAAEEAALRSLGSEQGIEEALLLRLESGSRTRRLLAIDDLARARLPAATGPLLAAARRPERAEQQAALRAAARAISVSSPAAQEEAAGPFVEAVATAPLSSLPLQEIFLQLGEATPRVVGALLRRADLPAGHLRAAIRIAAQREAEAGRHEVEALALHADPEVRAAALQTLAAWGEQLGDAGAGAVRANLEHELPFLRIHATRAAGLLPEEEALQRLWEQLGDRSWWVRVAAAQTLSSMGRAGRVCLERAAERHPDPFARDMALDQGAELQRKAA